MEKINGFYTLKGYQLHSETRLTTAMEDYIEMICRITQKDKDVRVCDLSRKLHVKPSSVSKMIQQLSERGYVMAEKYGQIYLTDKGKEIGEYFLYRHDVIHHFLMALNHSEDELEQVEKIEHFLNQDTVKNLEKLTKELLN